MMQDPTTYSNGKAIGTGLKWYKNGMPSDSSVYNKEGSGVTITRFDNEVPSSAGRYKAGYKIDGKLYDNDKLIDKQYFDETG